MKKLFKMSAVILFVLIVFSACGRNESVSGKITSFPPCGERVVTAIGDSIAAGYGLDSQEDNYLTLFSDNIGAVLNNDAVSGYDSGEVLKSLSDEKTAADIKNADAIVVSVGGNDFFHRKDIMIDALKKRPAARRGLLPGGSDKYIR